MKRSRQSTTKYRYNHKGQRQARSLPVWAWRWELRETYGNTPGGLALTSASGRVRSTRRIRVAHGSLDGTSEVLLDILPQPCDWQELPLALAFTDVGRDRSVKYNRFPAPSTSTFQAQPISASSIRRLCQGLPVTGRLPPIHRRNMHISIGI